MLHESEEEGHIVDDDRGDALDARGGEDTIGDASNGPVAMEIDEGLVAQFSDGDLAPPSEPVGRGTNQHHARARHRHSRHPRRCRFGPRDQTHIEDARAYGLHYLGGGALSHAKGHVGVFAAEPGEDDRQIDHSR